MSRNWICKDANLLAELYEIEPPGSLTDKSKEFMEQITYRMVKMVNLEYNLIYFYYYLKFSVLNFKIKGLY